MMMVTTIIKIIVYISAASNLDFHAFQSIFFFNFAVTFEL